MTDWTDNYTALVYPGAVGGGPAAGDELELTVTVTGGNTSSNPVKAAADYNAYDAEDADDKERHARFSDIVMFFKQYGQPVSIASDGDQVITLKFEQDGFWADSTVGDPAWLNKVRRSNAFELAAAYVADNDYNVSGIAVKVNGVTQSAG